jgi:hypothetical protein
LQTRLYSNRRLYSNKFSIRVSIYRYRYGHLFFVGGRQQDHDQDQHHDQDQNQDLVLVARDFTSVLTGTKARSQGLHCFKRKRKWYNSTVCYLSCLPSILFAGFSIINFPFIYTDMGPSSSSAADNDDASEEQLQDQDQDRPRPRPRSCACRL